MGGYVMTAIAAIINGVLGCFMDGSATNASSRFGASLVNGVAIILIVIGVLISFFKSKGMKEKLMSLAINGVIVVVGSFLIKAFVPVVIGLAIVAFFVIRFKITLPGLGGSGKSGSGFPTIIYDDRNVQYSKVDENESFARFRNEETGAEVVVYVPAGGITGNSVSGSTGNFHWY